MNRICFVATVDWPFQMFLNDQIIELSKSYEITLAYNTENSVLKFDKSIKIKHIPFERKLNPVRDFIALGKLFFYLKSQKFDIVHTINPKTGLLGSIASYLVNCRIRIHTFTGQVWVTKRGILKFFLRFMDVIICKFSTHIIVDSKSQLEFLHTEKILSVFKGFVPGAGTVGGINIERFKFRDFYKSEIRNLYNIPTDSFVYLFIGRLNKDKGVNELITAFKVISSSYSNTFLLIVGPDEENIKEHIQIKFGNIRGLIFVSFTNMPQKYFSASDVICLPSHREGFGTVILEAAAAGIPSIGSNIIGLRDAIIDNVTGKLHEVKNVDSLVDCMEYMLVKKEERLQMAINAKERVDNFFSQEKITSIMIDFYKSLF